MNAKNAIIGTAIVFIAAVLVNVVTYLTRIFLARELTLAEYGLFYAIMGLMVLFASIREFGLSDALTKFVPEFLVKKKYKELKSTLVFVAIVQFSIGAAITILTVIFAKQLAIHYFHVETAALQIQLMAIGFFFTNILTIYLFYLKGVQVPKIYAWIELVQYTVMVGLIFLFLRAGIRDLSPELAYMITPIIAAILFLPFFLRVLPLAKYKAKIDKKLTKTIFSFSIPVLIGSGAYMLISSTDTILLTYFKGVEKFALYTTAMPTAKLLLMLPLAVATIMFPLASEFWGRKDTFNLSATIKILYKYLMIFMLPLALIIFIFPETILQMLYGSRFVPAAAALKVLVIGIIFYSFVLVNISVINGIGKVKQAAKIAYIGAAINLVLSLILILLYDIIGAAIAITITYAVMLIMSTAVMKKNIKIKSVSEHWLKITMASLLFLGIIAAMKYLLDINPWVELVLCVVVGAAAYLSILFATKSLSTGSMVELKKLILRR